MKGDLQNCHDCGHGLCCPICDEVDDTKPMTDLSFDILATITHYATGNLGAEEALAEIEEMVKDRG